MLLPVLVGVAIIACLSGCASQRTPVESVNEAGFVAATRSGPYLLRIGDTIDVNFLTDETLAFSGPVTPAGGLSVPLVVVAMACAAHRRLLGAVLATRRVRR